jgi:polyvinyl alcohol dehydrogenase (cytochrome)
MVGRLKLKWAFGYRGDIVAVAAPSIVDGKLFVGSASGVIHALDARTGCLYWTYQADNTVRAAPVLTRVAGKSLLLVGDQAGNFYAIEATRGRLVWKKRIDDHESTRLTGAAIAFGDLVIVPAASWEELRALSNHYPCCTFRGSLTALKAVDGSVAWKTYLVESPSRTNDAQTESAHFGPSGAAVWSAPTLDHRRELVYIATGDNYSNPATPTSDAIIALELKTGRIVWSRQMTSGDVFNTACAAHTANCPAGAGPDFDFGAPLVLATIGGRDILLAGQKSGIV